MHHMVNLYKNIINIMTEASNVILENSQNSKSSNAEVETSPTNFSNQTDRAKRHRWKWAGSREHVNLFPLAY